MSVTPHIVACDWGFLNQLLEARGSGDLGFGQLGDVGESDDPRVFFPIDRAGDNRFMYLFSEFGQAIGNMVEAYREETRSFVQFAGPLMCLYCDGTNEMLVNDIEIPDAYATLSPSSVERLVAAYESIDLRSLEALYNSSLVSLPDCFDEELLPSLSFQEFLKYCRWWRSLLAMAKDREMGVLCFL